MHFLRKTLARSVEELDGIRPLWNELLRYSPKTMFQRFPWNRLALQTFRDRLTPFVCALESDSGAAILPAVINLHQPRLEFIGETLFDYRDVLSAGDPKVLQAGWRMLAQAELPVSVTAVQRQAAETSWSQFGPQDFAHAPQVDATKITGEQFRLLHTRAARQLRRLQRKGVVVRQHSGAEQSLVRRIYQLKCDQFVDDANNVFRDGRRREFMVGIAAEEADACEVFTLEDEMASIIAGLVTFLDGRVRRFYTVYFNPEWAAYSPGVALVFEVTALSLERGFSCDYMTGEYPYKLRFANASQPLYRIEASAEELYEIAHRQQRRIA